MVLMLGVGYEGVICFVLDVMISYGFNVCLLLLVGVGVVIFVEMVVLLLKKVLMCLIGLYNENECVVLLEKMLEDGINKIGLGL